MKTVFTIAMILWAGTIGAQTLPEAPDSGLGYRSPQEALAALRAKRGITEREENDWVVINDPSESSFWSIATSANPSYPSAVRRQLVETSAGISLKMGVMCGATKAICDRMVQSFMDGNKEIENDIARMRKRAGQ